MPKITRVHIQEFRSNPDKYGNTYYAAQVTHIDSGVQVCGKTTGGESNIRAIRRFWSVPDEWDPEVSHDILELRIREFNALVKDWENICFNPQKMAQYFRDKMREQGVNPDS